MSRLDAPPPPPPAMDSLEDLRAYLWKVHGVTVGTDDPILLAYTIHKVALDEIARLLDRHERLLSDGIRQSAQTFTDDVKAAIDAFQAEALTDTVHQRLAAMQEAARLSDTATLNFRRLVKILAGLSLVNILTTSMSLAVLAFLVL